MFTRLGSEPAPASHQYRGSLGNLDVQPSFDLQHNPLPFSLRAWASGDSRCISLSNDIGLGYQSLEVLPNAVC